MRKNWNKIGFGLGLVGLFFSVFGNVKANSNELKGSLTKKEAFGLVTDENYTSDSLVGDDQFSVYSPSISKTANSTAFKLNFFLTSENNYMVGYWGENDEYFPAMLQCSLKNKNDSSLSRVVSQEINFTESILKYVGMGSYLGQKEKELTCDILHGSDEEVDLEKDIFVTNIFVYNPETESDINNRKPTDINTRVKLKLNLGTNSENAKYKVYSLSNYVSFKYEGVSCFNGFSSYKVGVEAVGADGYISNPDYKTYYRKYEEDIESKKMYVRTRFKYTGDTKYVVEFKDGTTELISDIANSVDVSKDGSTLYFLLKNVNYNKVKNVTLKGAVLDIGIYNTETRKEVSRTGYSVRYAYMNFGIDDILTKNGAVGIAKDTKFYKFNCDLFLSLTAIAFIVVYLTVSIILYFNLKKKYANDEFKRMNTRQYFKNNLLGLGCLTSFILFADFIIVRFGVLSNSLPVYNPSDALLIVFALASLLFAAYFIRYFYILYKARKERIRNEKLKISADKIDDGTITINK